MILKAKTAYGDDANPLSNRRVFKFIHFYMRANRYRDIAPASLFPERGRGAGSRLRAKGFEGVQARTVTNNTVYHAPHSGAVS